MSGASATFESPRSLAMMAQITGLLERGAVTTLDLSAATGLHPTTLGGYLRYMAKQGEVYCSRRARKSQAGTEPATWSLGDGPTDDGIDHLPRKVIVRQQWEPNHVRMTLDCYLFGVPAVLGGAL